MREQSKTIEAQGSKNHIPNTATQGAIFYRFIGYCCPNCNNRCTGMSV